MDGTPGILALCGEVLRPNHEIVGTAPDGESAIAAFEALTPDVVVLDISMPGLNGLEVAKHLRRPDRSSAIVFLSGDIEFMTTDMEFMIAALKAGGSGFVKNAYRFRPAGSYQRSLGGSNFRIEPRMNRADSNLVTN